MFLLISFSLIKQKALAEARQVFPSFSEARLVHLSLKSRGLGSVGALLPPASPMSLIQNKLSK